MSASFSGVAEIVRCRNRQKLRSTQKPWSRIDRAWAVASKRLSLMLPSMDVAPRLLAANSAFD